jgi:hypothetical protein
VVVAARCWRPLLLLQLWQLPASLPSRRQQQQRQQRRSVT